MIRDFLATIFWIVVVLAPFFGVAGFMLSRERKQQHDDVTADGFDTRGRAVTEIQIAGERAKLGGLTPANPAADSLRGRP